MSRAAKLTLAATSAVTVAVVISVHYAQQAEKAVRLPRSLSVSNDGHISHISGDGLRAVLLGDACRGHS